MAVSHAGDHPNAHTLIFIQPGTRRGAALLMNSQNMLAQFGAYQEIEAGVARLLSWAGASPGNLAEPAQALSDRRRRAGRFAGAGALAAAADTALGAAGSRAAGPVAGWAAAGVGRWRLADSAWRRAAAAAPAGRAVVGRGLFAISRHWGVAMDILAGDAADGRDPARHCIARNERKERLLWRHSHAAQPHRLTQRIKHLIVTYPLTAYFLLAYGLMWIFALPLALSRNQGSGILPYDLSDALGGALFLLATFSGPTVAALIVTGLAEGRAGSCGCSSAASSGGFGRTGTSSC